MKQAGRNRRDLAKAVWQAFGWMLLAALPGSMTAATYGRVVVLVERSPAIYREALQGFQQGFGDAGKLEVLDVDASQPTVKLPAAENGSMDLVVAIGTRAAIAAKKANAGGAPLVYCLAVNPVQNQLTGANVAGVSMDLDFGRQLAELHKLLPRAQRIGVIYSEPVSGELIRRARRALPAGARLIARVAGTPLEAARAMDEVMRQVDAYWLLWDPVIANAGNFRLLVESSLQNKVPLIAPAPPFVEAGALMSIAPDYGKAGRRASEMARQILAGKNAADIGAEEPSDALLTINAAVARRLGITIPPNLQAEILAAREPLK